MALPSVDMARITRKVFSLRLSDELIAAIELASRQRGLEPYEDVRAGLAERYSSYIPQVIAARKQAKVAQDASQVMEAA